MLNNEQSGTNGWAVPREFPIQVFKMHNLAGVKCVLQNMLHGKAGQINDRNSCWTLLNTQKPHLSPGVYGLNTNDWRLKESLGKAPHMLALFLSFFERLQSNWIFCLTRYRCCVLMLLFLKDILVMKSFTKAMFLFYFFFFDVVNQSTAEKDKIIPVSSKSSCVPKEQLQL